ncbi:MAG TPA: hypothetical protein VK983_03580 [Candidatus Limnocylindrales bacterium]|nr:hypothetical protein [Candidatus Limnocylindrales bacterium]
MLHFDPERFTHSADEVEQDITLQQIIGDEVRLPEDPNELLRLHDANVEAMQSVAPVKGVLIRSQAPQEQIDFYDKMFKHLLYDRGKIMRQIRLLGLEPHALNTIDALVPEDELPQLDVYPPPAGRLQDSMVEHDESNSQEQSPQRKGIGKLLGW